MRRWRFLVWLLPPVILLSILAILYGPSLSKLWDDWNRMPDAQAAQVQTIADELRLSHPEWQFFQTPARNHVTFEFYALPDNDDQEELVSWFREAKIRNNVTFEMTLEFYEMGKLGESPNPPNGNTEIGGQGKKLLRRVEV